MRGRKFARRKVIPTWAILALVVGIRGAATRVEVIQEVVTRAEVIRAAAIQEAEVIRGAATRAAPAMADGISRTIRNFSRCFEPPDC